jgi:segregation and condensation protein A
MLLPTEEIEEEEVIGTDPRDELVAHLLEYKRYKEAARTIDSMPLLERDVFTRELEEDQPQLSEEPIEIKLSDLLEAFKSILSRTTRKDLIQLEPERLHIKDKMNLIIDKLTVSKRLTFNLLFEEDLSRMNIVTTFLALLELLKLQIVTVYQDEAYGTILIMKREETESAGDGDAPEH